MDEGPGNRADVVLHDLATGSTSVLAAGIVPWGPEFWSPDGTTVGYVVDTQGQDQGIWTVATDSPTPRVLVRGAYLVGLQTPGWDDVWQPAGQ
jgi:hypothetical protein